MSEEFFTGMSPQEVEAYKAAEEAERQAEIDQYDKDIFLIRSLKKQLPKKLFRQIANEIYESENWKRLEIVDKPAGKLQTSVNRSNVWVDQHVGVCSDDYYGSVYIELPDRKYLTWNYWM